MESQARLPDTQRPGDKRRRSLRVTNVTRMAVPSTRPSVVVDRGRLARQPLARRHSFVARTAVPYAQISVQVSPISEVSNRIARIALAPRRSASSIIRFMHSLRLS